MPLMITPSFENIDYLRHTQKKINWCHNYENVCVLGGNVLKNHAQIDASGLGHKIRSTKKQAFLYYIVPAPGSVSRGTYHMTYVNILETSKQTN